MTQQTAQEQLIVKESHKNDKRYIEKELLVDLYIGQANYFIDIYKFPIKYCARHKSAFRVH